MMTTQYHEYGAVVSDDNFWVNLASCFCEFYVAFKYFKEYFQDVDFYNIKHFH